MSTTDTTQTTLEVLDNTDIDWSGDTPVSKRFGDIYFSKDDGLEESRHVFLNGNNLPIRWQTLSPGEDFTIIETGFGTGLNFLCAVELWLQCAPNDARLHYLSVEKYPLQRHQIHRALSFWPILQPLAAELIDHYPPAVEGVHRRWLFDDRVALTLVFDDALRGLESLAGSDHPDFFDLGNPRADAWFLDGFSPAKNPQLWSASLFQQIARLSSADTTLATFTVARSVRDGLDAVGFSLHKTPGFGAKRDMLCGRYEKVATQKQPEFTNLPPRIFLTNSPHRPPWHLSMAPRPATKTALVIGAGIAGCATAAALHKRGWSVTIIDCHGTLAPRASGNPQGILYPRPSADRSALSDFGLHALCYALPLYQAYWRAGGGGNPCGVLVLPQSPAEATRFDAIAQRFCDTPELLVRVEGEDIQNLSGVELPQDRGLFFPALGWIKPREMCQWLTAGISLLKGEVATLERNPTQDLWQALDSNGKCLSSASVAVLCTSFYTKDFSHCQHLPLRTIRGQITAVPATAVSQELRTVLCGDGYLSPAVEGLHTLGATFDNDDLDCQLRPGDHLRNLQSLANTASTLTELLAVDSLDIDTLGGRADVRCATPDYLPIAGPAPHLPLFIERFADLRRNAKVDIPLPGCYHRGLWLNCGHGSRGFTQAPLAAELIASQINGDSLPLPRELVRALSPARFIVRGLQRNLI